MSAISSSIEATVVRTAQDLAGPGVVITSATVINQVFDSLEVLELAYKLEDEFTGFDGDAAEASWTRKTTLKDVADTLTKRLALPVDRSQQQLTDGRPVTPDHRELLPSGQQKGYVVLTEAERAKGFVRPYRDAYRHRTCGAITTMGRAIAETYARDPHFYSGTFCAKCSAHFPVGEHGEFTWYEMDGREGPKVGT